MTSSWQPTASNVQTKSLGMTAPINTEEPKPADIELTLALEVIDVDIKNIFIVPAHCTTD